MRGVEPEVRHTRRPAALALSVLLVVADLVVGGPRPAAHAVGTGNVLKRWAVTMSGDQAVTQAQAVTDAQNYDVIVARKNGTFTPYLAAMRAANPSVKMLVYLNGAYAQSYEGPTTGVYDATWYAKDATNNYVTTKGGQTDLAGDKNNWLMDVSNPGWVQDRAKTCTDWMASTSYDGCYVDMLGNPSVSTSYVTAVPVNPATAQNWTTPDWMDATTKLGAAVKSANFGHMVVGNGLQNGQQYFTADQGPTSKILDGLDGANAQGWIRGANDAIDQFPSTGNWQLDVNILGDAAGKGKAAMTMTKVWQVTPTPTQDQIDAIHRFTLASFLLGTDGKQYFLFDDDPNDGAVAGDHPYDHVDVGMPTGAYAQDSSGAYVRHFSRGLAVVNPSKKNTVTVSLGQPMANLEGQSMSQVTLPPDTGDVFTVANLHTSLALNPSSVVADHASTSTASLSITDAGGVGVGGQPVTFSTTGDVTFGSVTDHGDGMYTATITSSTTGGDEVITGHVGSLAATATLHELKPTTTALTTSDATTTFGAEVTLTATVQSAPSGVSTGNVVFNDGAIQIGAGPVDGAGRAQLVTATLPAGRHAVTAAYAGDAANAPSTSAAITQTVTPLSTSTALTSGPSPSTYGSPVTLTATVTSAGATPTGSVTFKDGAAAIGSAPVDATGHAQMTTSSLSVGRHSLGAAFGGDTNFVGSGARSVRQTVTKSATSAALASSANPAPHGSGVIFTATVSAAGATPAGVVTFKNGSTTLGSAALDANGKATLSAALSKAANSVTASYGGSTNFLASASPSLTQSLTNVPSVTSLRASRNPVTAPASVTFTATVTSAGGVPAGAVSFLDGSTSLGSAPLTAGRATLSVAPPPGGHLVTAQYNGDATFAGSTSPVAFERVNRTGAASASTALTNAPSRSTAGQPVTLAATVTGSGGPPTGTVWFFDNGNLIGSASLDSTARAAITTSSLAPGRHRVTAGYSGDSLFNPSISAARTQTVTAPTAMATSAVAPTRARAPAAAPLLALSAVPTITEPNVATPPPLAGPPSPAPTTTPPSTPPRGRPPGRHRPPRRRHRHR